MPNKNTKAAEQKIVLVLNAMKSRFSFDEYRTWNGRDIATEFGIGGQFCTVIKNLNLISTQRTKVKLNERMNSVRPSTIRKAMNRYAVESRNGKLKTLSTTHTRTPETISTDNFSEVMIALEKKVTEKIIAQLLAKLS